MNIVIVSTAYPLRGGIAHYVATLYKHLSRRHAVTVVTFSRQYPSVLFPGKSQEEQGGDEGVRIPTHRWVDSINPFSWFSAARKIAALKPDVLVFKYWLPFFGPCFGTIARSVRKRTKGAARTVFICDNIVPHERRLFDAAFTRYAFGAADACVVQSGAVERDLRSMFPNKPYQHVPHPIYDIFGQATGKGAAKKALGIRDENVMLYFGYVRKYKGLDVLLRAMPEIVKAVRVRLLVVGEFYGDEARYRKMVRDLKLETSVDITGEYVPNERVTDYFSAADVVVLPYLSATQSGIVQIAYNFNKPVIATDVGGLAEVVVDGTTGRIVSPNDPHALAQAVIRFYRKREEGTYVRGVHAEKKKYSWNRLVEAVETLGRPKDRSPDGSRSRKTGRGGQQWRRRGWDRSRGRRRRDGGGRGDG